MSALKTKMLTKNPDNSQSQSSEETKPENATGNANTNTGAPLHSGSTAYLQSISAAQQQQQQLPTQLSQPAFNVQTGNALQQPIAQQHQQPLQPQPHVHPSNPFFDATKQQAAAGFEQVECADWTEYFTKDGSNQPYYHSASLGKTVWEPPRDYLILKARRDQEEAAKRANSLVAQEMASHSHSGVRRHDNGNPFISAQDDAAVLQQQIPQQAASLNPFMAQPALINPFQALPTQQQSSSSRGQLSIGQPSLNPANPFATNSASSAQQSPESSAQVANLSTSQQIVNPFASNLTGSSQPTTSSSVSQLPSAHSVPIIVKRDGVQALPVITQSAADNPFRPQQNSFLASQMLGNAT